jgi:tetratricopeptide (TPR) repeat protein
MWSILISLLAGAVTAAAVFPIFWTWYAPILPAALVAGLSFFLILRWRTRLVQQAMEGMAPMLQRRDLVGAEQLMVRLQGEHGAWVPLLARQLDAQRGMLRYAQAKFDDAFPLLERGQWQNAPAQVALGCIFYRRGDKAKAYEFLERAASTSSKDATVYIVWAMLAHRAGDDPRALTVLGKGLAQMPGQETLVFMQGRIANGKKLDTKDLPQSWYQFFPDDLIAMMKEQDREQLQKAATRQRRVQPPPFPMPKMTKKMRRG